MKQIIQESLVTYDGREYPLLRLRFIPRKVIDDIVVLNYPRKGFHYHLYMDKHGRVGVVRTDEKTGKHLQTKIRLKDIRSKCLKSRL